MYAANRELQEILPSKLDGSDQDDTRKLVGTILPRPGQAAIKEASLAMACMHSNTQTQFAALIAETIRLGSKREFVTGGRIGSVIEFFDSPEWRRSVV